jgi:hypothetical protein
LFYDPVRNVTILRWKARSYNGSKADEYHIYRWSFDQPTRQLIAKVDGATFEYIDRERLDNIMYSYNIVAIYRVNGKETSFAYPTLNQKTPTEPTPAPAEFGCSATRHNAPGSPWLWLLALPLFGLIRRKERTL